MSASEFTLDINNPEEPKILCVGNNPDRQNIYGFIRLRLMILQIQKLQFSAISGRKIPN